VRAVVQKDRPLVETAGALRVLEDEDAVTAGPAVRNPVRVGVRLDHPEPAAVVGGHGDRLDHVRLAGEQRRPEAVGQLQERGGPPLFVGVSLALAAPARSAEPTRFPLRDGDTWVMAGDSITAQHLHSNYFEAFCYARYPRLTFHFRNSGVGGDTIPRVLARFDW